MTSEPQKNVPIIVLLLSVQINGLSFQSRDLNPGPLRSKMVDHGWLYSFWRHQIQKLTSQYRLPFKIFQHYTINIHLSSLRFYLLHKNNFFRKALSLTSAFCRQKKRSQVNDFHNPNMNMKHKMLRWSCDFNIDGYFQNFFRPFNFQVQSSLYPIHLESSFTLNNNHFSWNCLNFLMCSPNSQWLRKFIFNKNILIYP